MTSKRRPLNAEQQALAVAYLPMANNLARRYTRNCPYVFFEVRSEVYYALSQAAESFDPAAGVRFSTFANIRMRGALKDWQTKRRLKGYRGRSRSGTSPTCRSAEDRDEESGRVLNVEEDLPVGALVDSVDLCEHYFRQLPSRQAALCRMLFLEEMPIDMICDALMVRRSMFFNIRRDAFKRLAAIIPPPQPRRAQRVAE